MTTAEIARRVKQLEERVGYRDAVFVTSVSSTVARPMDPNVNVVGDDEPTSAFETAEGIGTEA